MATLTNKITDYLFYIKMKSTSFLGKTQSH